MKSPKILLLDIETAPNLVHVWGLWGQNIGLNQIQAAGYVLCWASKWLGEPEIMFSSVRKGKKTMLKQIHKLLSEADAVIHYNGTKFDVPTLNKEFISHGMMPPAPYKEIDLLKTARKKFRFPSNKLDYIAKALGFGGKIRHEGHELWTGCMAGNDAAWERMEKYNTHDVALLEKVYYHLLPWISDHANIALYENRLACPNCGGVRHQRRGYHYTRAAKYQRYQCKDCGNWFRGAKSQAIELEKRAINL